MAEVWQDRDELAAALAANGWSNRRTARALNCDRTTIGKWREKHGIEGPTRRGTKETAGPKGDTPGMQHDGDDLRVTTPLGPNTTLGDVRVMIEARGLDPDEWEVERVKVNEWEGFLRGEDGQPQKVKLEQLTAYLRRVRTWDFLVAASTDVAGRVFACPKDSPRADGKPRIEFIGGDQQAGYHDRKLHEAVCLWLRDTQPDGINLTGDTVDLPTISRHADRPHWNLTPQECLDAGYALLYDYCDAAPNARKRKLRGNHDYRLESEMLARAERLWGLRPAQRDDEDEQVPLYSIRRLLRLDELAIELHGREGDKWQLAEIPLADDLVVMHQPPPVQKFTRLGKDVVAGDSHRQKIEHVTVYDAGVPTVRTLMQVGLLADANGLGYTSDPDWQQGFGTVTVWPDGGHLFELARWDGRTLTWRGETWRP